MSNLKTIISSFKLQDELNPKIWYIPNEKYMGDPEGQKEKLRSDIRERLLEISQYFIDSFDIDVVIDDIIITGSLVNFNWSKFSDVDLHIVIDFSQFPEKYKQTFKDFLNLKKMIFNLKHNIKVKDFDVELYAQDSDEAHFSMGTYSVLNDEWIKYPKKEEVEIDTLSIKNKSKHWMDLIDSAIEESQELELEEGLELLKKIKDKIKTFRTSGLEKGGEYSVENLVFKVLRRNGYLEKLFDFQNGLMDKKLTLKESNTIVQGNLKTDLENGPKNHGARAFGNWQSDNAWDMFAPAGTIVKSFTDGIVSNIRNTGKNSGKVFGTQVSIKGTGDYPDIFYTHLKDVKLKVGDKVSVGDVIGPISEWVGHDNMTHVHVGLPYGLKLSDLIQKGKKGSKYSLDDQNGLATTFLNFLKNIFTGTALTESLSSPLPDLKVVSQFGPRGSGYHPGVDLGVKSGVNVSSPEDGIVIDSATRADACGGTLFIDHQNGFKSRYCHLKKINFNKGDKVNKGDIVGLSGGGKNDIGKGNSQGPHLHFELYKDGKVVNPMDFINKSDVGNKKTEEFDFTEILKKFFSKVFGSLKD